ncbi:hypothetical protein GMRT_14965 [Giardia muris]|uniref:Uncharacterized protein n=1 Tax=Giardia muris TaxID=5742 RepID=A0A4Z1T0G4_GIAMU|nr:hypothetical protein GMRT_14965 [Giardia muris]|eukprot:TNJ29198.1 hypothetical protein GMRT_14965 [Giardia muris]
MESIERLSSAYTRVSTQVADIQALMAKTQRCVAETNDLLRLEQEVMDNKALNDLARETEQMRLYLDLTDQDQGPRRNGIDDLERYVVTLLQTSPPQDVIEQAGYMTKALKALGRDENVVTEALHRALEDTNSIPDSTRAELSFYLDPQPIDPPPSMVPASQLISDVLQGLTTTMQKHIERHRLVLENTERLMRVQGVLTLLLGSDEHRISTYAPKSNHNLCMSAISSLRSSLANLIEPLAVIEIDAYTNALRTVYVIFHHYGLVVTRLLNEGVLKGAFDASLVQPFDSLSETHELEAEIIRKYVDTERRYLNAIVDTVLLHERGETHERMDTDTDIPIDVDVLDGVRHVFSRLESIQKVCTGSTVTLSLLSELKEQLRLDLKARLSTVSSTDIKRMVILKPVLLEYCTPSDVADLFLSNLETALRRQATTVLSGLNDVCYDFVQTTSSILLRQRLSREIKGLDTQDHERTLELLPYIMQELTMKIARILSELPISRTRLPRFIEELLAIEQGLAECLETPLLDTCEPLFDLAQILAVETWDDAKALKVDEALSPMVPSLLLSLLGIEAK